MASRTFAYADSYDESAKRNIDCDRLHSLGADIPDGLVVRVVSGVKHGAVIPKCLQERFATVHDRPHWVLIKAVTGWVFVSALVDNFWSPECHFR